MLKESGEVGAGKLQVKMEYLGFHLELKETKEMEITLQPMV